MNFHKTYNFLIGVFTSLVITVTIADGGGPMPPIPPSSNLQFIADGGGPMPPIPPSSNLQFIADGGGPMPPIPPQLIA